MTRITAPAASYPPNYARKERPRAVTPIDRRQFAAALLASSLSAQGRPYSPAAPAPSEPEHFLLQPNGWMPNNPRLPVLLYRAAFPSAPADSLATTMEQAFTANGWPPQWRNGIYTFHHFHSTAHEILGIAAGEVHVTLGGPRSSAADGGSRDLTLRTGDVVALPAGTGHCRLSATSDLLVIGAYPANQRWDICRTAPSPQTLEHMQHVPFPPSDPVHGAKGPLPNLWPAT